MDVVLVGEPRCARAPTLDMKPGRPRPASEGCPVPTRIAEYASQEAPINLLDAIIIPVASSASQKSTSRLCEKMHEVGFVGCWGSRGGRLGGHDGTDMAYEGRKEEGLG